MAMWNERRHPTEGNLPIVIAFLPHRRDTLGLMIEAGNGEELACQRPRAAEALEAPLAALAAACGQWSEPAEFSPP
jgi:hypothetical protein